MHKPFFNLFLNKILAGLLAFSRIKAREREKIFTILTEIDENGSMGLSPHNDIDRPAKKANIS